MYKNAKHLLNNRGNYYVSSPTIGEFYLKSTSLSKDSFNNLHSLITRCKVIPQPVRNSCCYRFAMEAATILEDKYHDYSEAMDALIIASAASDHKCDTFYTTDSKMNNNFYLKKKLNELRSEFYMDTSFEIQSLSIL